MTRSFAAPRAGRWLLLTALLGIGYLFIGLTSPLTSIRWALTIGGLLVLAAAWLVSRSRAAALTVLVLGALIPVLFAWSSLVVPLTAVMLLICGLLAGRRLDPTPAPPGREPAQQLQG